MNCSLCAWQAAGHPPPPIQSMGPASWATPPVARRLEAGVGAGPGKEAARRRVAGPTTAGGLLRRRRSRCGWWSPQRTSLRAAGRISVARTSSYLVGRTGLLGGGAGGPVRATEGRVAGRRLLEQVQALAVQASAHRPTTAPVSLLLSCLPASIALACQG